jgi:hypothetical protein
MKTDTLELIYFAYFQSTVSTKLVNIYENSTYSKKVFKNLKKIIKIEGVKKCLAENNLKHLTYFPLQKNSYCHHCC